MYVSLFLEILKLVLAGRMGEAIDLTSRLYPGLLERDPNLLFALKCRQFVEMVNGSDSEVCLNNSENQTSVIQSTKTYTKSSVNGNVEEMNLNNAMNGATDQQIINGQIEDDVEMEENTITNGIKNNNGYQNGNPNTNGYKCQNGEDVDMGRDFFKEFLVNLLIHLCTYLSVSLFDYFQRLTIQITINNRMAIVE